MGGDMSYKRVGRRWAGSTRGFRLNPKRFCVQRLRARFFYLFRLLHGWRSSYGHALQSLKKGICSKRNRNSSSNSSSSSRRRLVMVEEVPNVHVGASGCGFRSFGRSNSFYSEAIADCLEFIKRSSLSVDDNSIVQR